MKKRYILLLFLQVLAPFLVYGQGEIKLPDSIRVFANKFRPEIRDSVLLFVGNLHYQKGTDNEYNIAFSCFLEALNYAEKYHDNEALAYCYLRMGAVYDAQQNPEAIKYYSLYYNRLVADNANEGMRALAAYNLAALHSRQKNRDSTLKYVAVMQHFADNFDKNQHDPAGNVVWQTVYVDIAYAMLMLHDNEKLKYYFRKLPDTAKFHKARQPYDRLYAEIKSQYLLVTGDTVNFLRPVLEQLAGKNCDSVAILKRMVDLLVQNHQYKEAYECWDKLGTAADKNANGVFRDIQYKLLIAEKEQKDKINELLNNEHERLVQRNIMLFAVCLLFAVGFLIAFFGYRNFRSQNIRLSEQNKKIQEQSDNIESLIKEIHHRVKNNLQIISSLIDLQQIKDNSANILWLREIQSKMRSIALAHQVMYEQQVTGEVSVQYYFDQMVRDVLFTLVGINKIEYSVDMDDLQMGLDELIPFALIINEALVNTVKHAIPKKPDTTIIITGRQTGREVTIRYRDTGPGLPTSLDPKRSASMGLRLIRKLATQLGAKMTTSSEPGQQLEYTFILTR